MIGSPQKTYDAVIVGSGPAGSSAAFRLASQGASVAVLERARLPRYKTCGGGVLARARRWLPAAADVRPERTCEAVELNFLKDGLHFLVRRPEPLIMMMMRAEFDLTLLDAARKAGAEVIDGCSFAGLAENGNALEIATSRGPMRTRFLIGADGVLGPVAQAAGWRDSPTCIPALECEAQVSSRVFERFSRTARFDIGEPVNGYGWVFPKRQHLSVGLLRMRRGRAGLRNLLDRYLGKIGVDEIRGTEHHGFLIPVRPRRGGFTRGRVLLVGDSAGFADPITGEGISHAIRSGQLAGRALLDAELDQARAARNYRRSLRREILPELRAGRILARLFYQRPGLRRMAFRRFGQPLCEGVAQVTLGRRSYLGLLANPMSYLKIWRLRAA